MNQQIEIRVFALRHNLENLNKAYIESTKDSFLEVGLKYDTDYKYDKWLQDKIRDSKDLRRKREWIMFTYVLNFTQTFFSIKEYLKKLNPKKSNRIERYFSDTDHMNLSKKMISNDLKHNPSNDIKFDFQTVKKETRRYLNTTEQISYMKNSWFYGELETVEYCTSLFNQLIAFINEMNSKE